MRSLFILSLLILNSIISIKINTSEANASPGYKGFGNHNPCLANKFTADPGVMVYNDRIYVYGTNDGKMETFIPPKNDYGKIKSINVMSSDDMVNWSDDGTINVAGSEGIAKWAGNSWAPCATHKMINGKEKFFLYFANSGNGVGVLTADSPTGPWTDPLGHALIHRGIPNCDVVWLFDPAVLIDDDGTGYLYFGGGVPFGQDANPRQHRAVKLGPDMISLAGDVVSIDAPWSFEDSGINKINGEYYYSYCTNWAGGTYGNARIAYMKSNNPLFNYQFKGTCFNNPGDFFGTGGNNHHTIIEFKNQFYIFYHAEWLNRESYGQMLGYRTTHVDVMPFSGGAFGNAIGTLKGVTQLKNVNPFEEKRFQLMAWSGGVTVYGLGPTACEYSNGDWSGVSNVDFGTGAKSIQINAGAANGAVVKITIDSLDGPQIGSINIPPTRDQWIYVDVTGDISGVTGVHHVFFTAIGQCVLNSYKFS